MQIGIGIAVFVIVVAAFCVAHKDGRIRTTAKGAMMLAGGFLMIAVPVVANG